MRKFYTALVYLVMFCIAPRWANAQEVLPETVEVRVIVPDGSGAPPVIATRETAIMPGGTRCGQPKVAPNPNTVNPTQVAMDDPFAGASVDCVVPMPTGIPDGGNYLAYALYHSSNCILDDGVTRGPCNSAYSNYTESFSVVSQPPPDPCAGAVVLAVGDWTRSAGAATLGRVLFSLGGSAKPVTLVIVRLGKQGSTPQEMDRLTGNDLRKVAGSYFRLPLSKGSYLLSVEAQDANGCSDGGSRPMTIDVK
jgi:hypothetical protein